MVLVFLRRVDIKQHVQISLFQSVPTVNNWRVLLEQWQLAHSDCG